MADLPLCVAVMAPAQVDPAAAPGLISGRARAWFRARRSEPFAACLSVSAATPELQVRLLPELESSFRAAARYSITTSLNRALQTVHTGIREENRSALPEDQWFASGILAAVRGNGVYVARSGSGLVASVRGTSVWARSADPSGRETSSTERLGSPAPLQVISEFFPVSEGDVVILVPGLSLAQVPDGILSAALARPLEIEPIDALLALAPWQTAALVICWPAEHQRLSAQHGWMEWAAATPVGAGRSAPGRRPVPRAAAAIPADGSWPAPSGVAGGPVAPPDNLAAREPRPSVGRRSTPGPAEMIPHGLTTQGRAPDLMSPRPSRAPASPARQDDPDADRVEQAPTGEGRVRESFWSGWTRLVALLPLGILLAIAFLLLRGVVPLPGGSDQAIAEAWHILQGAEAESDPETKADLLSRAIDVLEPRAPRDEAARVLLHDAQKARDQVRNIIRVSRVHRFNLVVDEPFRPAGLWKTDEGLFILDLGGQVLYRTDVTGTQLTRTLKPGDSYDQQPLGLLVSAAWSPPRGANAEGRMLVLDNLRSIVSLTMDGSNLRRWWPADSGMWQRIGPAAATHDDLFFLDKEKAQIWKYPARLPGAAGTVVADASREPQLGSAIDLATDGNLYVLLPGGSITKLAPGSGKLPFDGTVPDRPITGANAICAQPDGDRVWVLEPSAARVVEFTPQGNYVRQFVFPPEMIWNAIALHVDAGSRDLRVLTPQHVLLVQME